MWNLIKLSLKNIQRHPVKNFLVGLLIFLASFFLFMNASLDKNAQRSWRDYFSTTFLGDYHVTTSKGLDRDYTLPAFSIPSRYVPGEVYDYLEKNNVSYSKRLKLGAAVYNQKTSEFEGSLPTLIGVNFQTELKRLDNLLIREGKYDPAIKNGVLVWKEYADKLHWKTGQEITLYVKDVDGDSYPYNFRVMGILDHKEGADLEGKGVVMMFPTIMAPYDRLAEILGVEKGEATDVPIWDKTGVHEKAVQELASKYDLQFFYGPKGYGIVYGVVELMNFFSFSLALIILVILIISTLNLNMLGFFERQKEIGGMIAMGAKPRWIVSLLLMEMVVFATVAFAAALLFFGLVAGTSGGIDFGEMGAFFAGKKVFLHVVWESVFGTYITVLFIMLVSSIYPIYLTTKINPIDVFREADV
jgi:ABC-type antimicrobial peptide transport system permease subunit